MNAVARVRRASVATGLLWVCGCGYVGEPEPPLLNIPSPITDVAAVQVGDRAAVTFSFSPLSTEGVPLQGTARLQLRAGPAPNPFDVAAWEAGAHIFAEIPAADEVEFDIPVSEWAGQEILVAAQATGANGRASGWSNFARLAVVKPLARPEALRGESTAQGIRLAWQGSAPRYRVLRKGADDEDFAPYAESPEPSFLDGKAEFGKAYFYRIEAIANTPTGIARSLPSAALVVEPVDRFAPAPPAGLTAVGAPGSVELLWERSTEGDFAGYRIYRAEGEGEFTRIAETAATASYSDRTAASGRSYRYAVTAVDRAGNESERSPAAEATAP